MSLGLAICTPIPTVQGPLGLRLEPITVEFQRARANLACPTNFTYCEIHVDGKEVGEARCMAARYCLDAKPQPEFLFFLDYDVLPFFDALTKLVYRARCYPDYDIFAGVYCCKSSVAEPLIYTEDGHGPYWDWTLGDLLFNIQGIHMGCTLIRTSLFQRMVEANPDKPLFHTILEKKTLDPGGGLKSERGTEDLYFCKRARTEVGAKILVDTSVLCGHINNKTGQIFGLPKDSPPVTRAKWLPGGGGVGVSPSDSSSGESKEPTQGASDTPLPAPLKRAIDLGAGSNHRSWPGYEVETTDIRPEVHPTYVMDTRQLNLPDDHYDLVASSHHLEHFGRYEQEQLWREMYRILKPGGRMEHTVPNAKWAAAHIADGRLDEDVFNVLWGAQESHGYARHLNAHFFGYTPEVARELAAEVGLVNIEVRSYEEDPDLYYDLIVTGEKPNDGGPQPAHAVE